MGGLTWKEPLLLRWTSHNGQSERYAAPNPGPHPCHQWIILHIRVSSWLSYVFCIAHRIPHIANQAVSLVFQLSFPGQTPDMLHTRRGRSPLCICAGHAASDHLFRPRHPASSDDGRGDRHREADRYPYSQVFFAETRHEILPRCFEMALKPCLRET